ncbi:MAG: SPFH domain-containing protein [Candidatus Eremiobacteraeota bacterium]|nr:SPFH domain-containing protein [Candidatus Eremiobacteraeota bacterium]
MFGIKYLKSAPTTYIFHYGGGRLRRQGPGLSFFYYAPASVIVSVPLASHDLPFVFQEVTRDFQALTVQGQISYRVLDAGRLSALLDYSIYPDGTYLSDDPTLLEKRLVDYTQIAARSLIQGMMLREALVSVEKISAEVIKTLKESEQVALLGTEIMSFSITSARPSPEMARALEAEAREALQGKADEAIYERRNAAVLQERRIKESELATELAVEEKRRQIRESQMAADIAVEEQRSQLISRRVENDRSEADARAYALEATLKPVKDVDWRTLMAFGAGSSDPGVMIAMAFRELAENAGKIGELNVSPDLLKTLLGKGK